MRWGLFEMISGPIRRRLRNTRNEWELGDGNWAEKPPLFVYQMGKVGSRSLYESLSKGNLPYSVFHVHWLSDQGIEFSTEVFRATGAEIPENLYVSRILRKRLDAEKPATIRVITLARDPVRRMISDFFQGLGVWNPDCKDESGRTDGDRVVALLQERFNQFDESNDWTCSWFDKEFKLALGIDIYAHPFDPGAGFSTISHGGVEVLVLRLEDLTRCFNAAICRFLDLDQSPPLVYANATAQRDHGDAYRYVLRKLTISESVLRKIYSSKYARHFHYDWITGGLPSLR